MIQAPIQFRNWAFTRAGWCIKTSFPRARLSSMNKRYLTHFFGRMLYRSRNAKQPTEKRPLARNEGWLVHLYEEEGDEFFEKLNGLFSGLLIDKGQSKAFLLNDRYGLERIYWHETKDAIYFASEAKALLRILPKLRQFDDEGVAQYLTFGCTLEWRTLFKDVQLLPAGSVWSFENGRCQKRRYFSPETWEAQPTDGREIRV